MAWPTDDLSGEHADAGSDSPALFRPMMKKIVDYLKTIIGARGQADGVCDLDTNGKVPGWRTGRGEANGAAPLDANAKVPRRHLPAATSTEIGAVELATGSETIAGTNLVKAVSPGSLKPALDALRVAGVEDIRLGEETDGAVPAGKVGVLTAAAVSVTTGTHTHPTQRGTRISFDYVSEITRNNF